MSTALAQAAGELLSELQRASFDDDRVDERIIALFSSLRDAPRSDHDRALALLAGGVELPSPASAGVAAAVVGGMLEAGLDPAAARDPLLDCLRRLLPGCIRILEAARAAVGDPPADLPEELHDEWLQPREDEALSVAAAGMPAAADAWQRLARIWPGLIALLSVDAGARAAARELLPVVERIEQVHEAGGWLTAIMRVIDDEPFVAIEPATGLGIGGRLSGIVENFQLTVLLMDALPGEARVSRTAAAVARGDGPQQLDETVTGHWSLYSHAALDGDGELPDPTDLSRGDTWIWHESSPADIPVLDGHRVILLGPAAQPRTWPVQRAFLRLQASLAAEPLDDEAVAAWLERIAAAAARPA